MREIKFRAWNDLSKRMEYDCWITNDGKRVIEPDGDYYPFPIMQFTGLKDKNGKEIYEGDIVRICHEDDYDSLEDKIKEYADCGWRTIEVKFEVEKGGYVFDAEELFGHEYIYPIVSDGYVTETIGNIYENPELLTPSSNKADLSE